MAAHHAVRCALLDPLHHGHMCTTQKQSNTSAVKADAPAPALNWRKQVIVHHPAVCLQALPCGASGRLQCSAALE